MKGLSVKQERKMGFTGSSSKLIKKKFKPSRKVLHECNTVNYSSVPRKLRSAMKKRSPQAIPSPLPEKNKLRVKRKDVSEKELITKDEEDAVETLISLAELLPTSTRKSGLGSESTKDTHAVLAPVNEETLQVKWSIEQSVSLTKSKQLVGEEVGASKSSSEIEVAIGAAVGSLLKRQLRMDGSKAIGLWPGLTSKDGTSNIEVSRDSIVRNKSQKRCIGHVHISRLIKSLQTAAKTKNHPMKENEKPKQVLLETSVPKISIFTSAPKNDEIETKNAILLHRRLLQNQQQPSSVSNLYTTSKQTLDFSSLLSTGENQINGPLSLLQNRHYTPPVTDFFPVTTAKQMQMQSYYPRNPMIDSTQLGNLSLPSQHWTSQLASPYNPMSFTSTFPQSSVELLHPKYVPFFPQQGHSLIPLAPSLPNPEAKKPRHHYQLPPRY